MNALKENVYFVNTRIVKTITSITQAFLEQTSRSPRACRSDNSSHKGEYLESRRNNVPVSIPQEMAISPGERLISNCKSITFSLG